MIWDKIESGELKISDKEKELVTACKGCPQSVWHITANKKLRVYCQLMSSLIDEPLLDCDGLYIIEE